MSKKRKRDGTEVNVDLVNIYDSLAHEDEAVRLKAARQLLTKTFQDSQTTTEEEIKTIVKRLFRGLCSSRKAARLGFVVALTEFLSQLQTSSFKSAISPSQVVDSLEACTEVEGGSRGQEERDYYFGRVFGAGAIVQSGILFSGEDRSQWKRLLDLLCSVALKKPWLRQECGWTLCQFVAVDEETASNLKPFVEDVIDTLNTQKLIRTPEGAAIWLTAQNSYPESKLARHVWKYSHPLAAKDINNLAEVMKNARTQQADAQYGAQGSTVWSANLHFAWMVILNHLYQYDARNGISSGIPKAKSGHDLVEFSEFWKVVVDQGLFGAGTSNERRLWGVLLFAQVASTATISLIHHSLSTNTLHCLMSAFSGEDRYLHKSAQSALQQLEKRIRSDANWQVAREATGKCLEAIVGATQAADFDSATKSRIVATLLDKGDQRSTWKVLTKLQTDLRSQTEKVHTGRLKYLVNLEYKLLASCIRQLDTEKPGDSEVSSMLAIEMLKHGLQRADNEPEDLQQYVKDRNAGALEQLIKAGSSGHAVFTSVLSIQDLLSSTADPAIRETLEAAAKRLRKLEKAIQKQPSTKQPGSSSLMDGYRLLYALVAFDIYNGEQESIEIMQDLLEVSQANTGLADVSTDPLVEILLSFSSRPSKFLRTLTPIIFESIAPGITAEGIQSLTRVLATKENAQGQQEMFEAADEQMVDGAATDDDETDNEDEELDSDVEIVDANASSNDDSSSESESDSESDAEDDEEGDELAAFDAALASALGTNREDDESADDSDADMDDDEMMALDEKLTEVFKARKQASSKKKDQKDAKGNVINFKNRVLDLIEVYVKHQYLSPYVVDLVLPLLQSIRTSQTKQITERSHKVLKELCTRCKGQNVPQLEHTSACFEVFRAVHHEACLEASNNHSSAASQASLLLVKVLIKGGASISSIVGLYAATNTKMLTDSKCKVQPGFFTDWNNWCVTARSYTTKLA